MELKRIPLVMGVLNVTPDSFSDGGDFADPASARERAIEMIEQGADMIDVGGESSRPGAAPVSADVELRRVLPVIEALAGEVNVPLSIDTRRAVVAAGAIEAGCHIVNDITACRDPEMPSLLRESGAAVVLMHMQGDPRSMQSNPYYDDVTAEVTTFLAGRVEMLSRAGIDEDRIIVDPGIGFGKRFRDNLELLNNVRALQRLGHPLLVGASRKRFLGELLDAHAAQRLSGSLAVAAHAYEHDVDIIRVHDVKETVDMFRVLDAIAHPGDYSANW